MQAPLWALGFSGGKDSTALLHALWRWRAEHTSAPPMLALHVNHALQPASAQWAAHCEALCSDWSIPFECLPVQVAEQASTEAAARDARYAALQARLPEGAILFLAHHLDDQIETFFLRLMRGGGLEGLSGMPISRPLGRAEISRPLLGLGAAHIEAYAQRHALRYMEDPSNADTRIDRNYLRHSVLPLLEERWPAYRDTVARAVGHVSEARDSLRESHGIPPTQIGIMGDKGVEVRHLLDTAAPHRLRAWLQAVGLLAPDQAALGEFLRQLRSGGDNSRPVLNSGRYVLQRYREVVYVVPPFAAEPPVDCVLRPGEAAELAELGCFSLVASTGSGYALKVADTPRLTWGERNQRVRLVGRDGSRTLKSVFQELGVPPWWRSRVPLLMLGDEVLQVGDLVTCNASQWVEKSRAGQALWRLQWERFAPVND